MAKGLRGEGESTPPYTHGPYTWDIDTGAIVASGEERALGMTTTGTLASGAGLVGLNVVTTTAGTAGSWASAIYGKIVQGTTKNVNGYLSAAEFEASIAGTYNCSDYCVIALNSTVTNSGGAVSHPAFIYIREYGTKVTKNLFWFADAAELGTTVSTTLVSTSADDTATHKIQCLVGTTPIWILATTTAPH